MTHKEKLLLFLLDYLKKKNNFVLLWDGKCDKGNLKTYIFTSPVKSITCHKNRLIKSKLLDIEKYLSCGYHLAGFISYEAGLSFEKISSLKQALDFPLLWFGVYKNPIIFDHKSNKFYKNKILDKLLAKYIPSYAISHKVKNLKPNLKKHEYIKNIDAIKKLIEEGQTYQVNYTFKRKFNLQGDSESLFFNLCAKQSTPYTAFIRTSDKDILCLSPELFFKKEKDKIIVKPMKGTIDRGKDNTQDNINKRTLENSIKNRAENIMIVDLLRNDLGRISKTGSVKTNSLLDVEKYETLFQMTSSIESRLKARLSWYELFFNIFPSGSVTGAPKISTMKIIKKLEKEPRKIYTGSIGYIAPNKESTFNVAIRTILLDRNTKKGEIGIGSGIVYDSDGAEEYNECLLKSNFLTSKHKDFKLIETILWKNNKYYLLNLHLNRLKESSFYFNYNYFKSRILKALGSQSQNFKPNKKYRVRLLLSKDGKIAISSSKIDKFNTSNLKAIFSKKKVDSSNAFFYHKTTNRKLYDAEFKKAREKGFFDVIFTNINGEVTEGAISNIVIRSKNRLYTPPVKSGLLNGVLRQHLLSNKLKEKTLVKSDIFKADKVYLINSVREILQVKVVKHKYL